MYYTGIDLGTSSIGWALTDEKYNLIRKKGKDLWGVRLFDEAKSAEERRNYRVSRRRRNREVARIGMLKAFFSDEIEKVDAGFYQRLEESKYHKEDKYIESKYALFADKGYTDVEYYKEYPTVFHLRKELLESDKKHDVRLVYLAILNLFKHRGHFLNAFLGETNERVSISDLYKDFFENVHEGFKFPETINFERFEEILSDNDLSRSAKTEKVAEVLGIISNKNKAEYEIVKMFCGLSGKLAVVFGKEELGEEYAKMQLSFRDGKYEENIIKLDGVLGEEKLLIIESIKAIHDDALLCNIMKGSTYLSEARVKVYEKHACNLKLLKEVIKEYIPEEYDGYFRIISDNNYSGYIGSVNSKKQKERRSSKASEELFIKETKRLLSLLPNEDKRVCELLKEAEKGSLFPKQLTFENGVVPNQIHLAELKKILINAEKYLSFLKDKDETGLTVSERIIQLFQFQIPYYIGPVHIQGEKSDYQWAVRKEKGCILPWNLEDKIDVEETRKNFILRMVKHCTYLSGETALPKNSLKYERFMVLNELNNLRINGDKIGTALKQSIYNELFLKGKKVSLSQLRKYLISNGIISEKETDNISGIDGGFQQSLVSYGRFYAVLGEGIKLYENQVMAEEIIYWGTIYANDRKLMKKLITEKYGQKNAKTSLTEEQIKRILGYKWKDWGKLSKEFLELQGCHKGDGICMNLLEAMWENSDNLMEILSDKYTFADTLRDKQSNCDKLLREYTYDDLRDTYLSAPVKRMTWQTLLIIKELCQVMGDAPEKIFIEMPRSEGEKGKRTTSRKKKFEELYKKCKDEGREWQKELADFSEADFRSKKLYLYYLQKGRCMYTGDSIAIGDLFNDNLYDIDHIYPRHFVKDDSLENNLVLVKKQINSHKSDTFPIEQDIRKNMYSWWKELLDVGFISKEKFNRLTRSWDFTEEERASFINRQIVETGQATKHVAGLLKQLLPDTEIVYVKAGNVSEFRHKTKLLKSRSVNDFHHAQDAYLNIVVGNAYYTKFTKNPANFIRECRGIYQYHMDKIFQYDIKRNGEMAWKAGENGTIATVRKVIDRNTPLITKRTYEAHGGIAKQTIYTAQKSNSDSYIPIKQSDERMADVTKYGGFTSVSGAYYFLVEHEKKGKRIRTLEQMPIYLKNKLEIDDNALKEYCVNKLGYVDPDIRIKKIRFKSLLKRNGYYLNLSGKTGIQILVDNAIQLNIQRSAVNYIRHLENFKENAKDEDYKNIVNKESNEEIYRILLQKHKETIYNKKPNPLWKKMEDCKNRFIQLSLKEQVNVLLELLKASSSQNLAIDAKELNLKASSITILKDVSSQEEFLLIHQSITGIYTRTIDLKTV